MVVKDTQNQYQKYYKRKPKIEVNKMHSFGELEVIKSENKIKAKMVNKVVKAILWDSVLTMTLVHFVSTI